MSSALEVMQSFPQIYDARMQGFNYIARTLPRSVGGSEGKQEWSEVKLQESDWRSTRNVCVFQRTADHPVVIEELRATVVLTCRRRG